MAKRKRYEDHMLLAPGERVPGRQGTYVVDRVAGMGSFGAVYSARDPALPGRHVALKEFFAPRHPRERGSLDALFERERTVGDLASPHPLMPTFYEAFEADGHHYIAQEFIEGATLDLIILKRHPLPRAWTLKWAVSLCDALAFLHSRGVVHHDLKPANIRITPQGHLALLDFGAAQYFGKGHEHEKPIDLYGTEGYLPPELDGDGQWVADARTDIFAVGCILYEMIAGTAPDQESINQRSMYVTNSLMQQPNADLGMIRLINKALSYNTEYRYASANDFLLEMRQIAPPVLLVTKKHLRFGEVTRGQSVTPQHLSLYNAGGGQIRGEIKPRTAWVMVTPVAFHHNRQEVGVGVDTSRIAERGQVVSGRLEINTPDIHDEEGRIVSQGDRWFVECSVMVTPRPGVLVVAERPAPNSPPIALAGRRGQEATGVFHLRNDGDTSVEFTVDTVGAITATPSGGRVEPGQEATIEVQAPTAGLPAGVHETTLTVRPAAGPALTVPLSLHVQSPLAALKSVFGRREGRP
ncbi:MAG: serine/threonine protein kinase [Armatimonadetes bacterium]|nr:serine/threonine protein kinase [Armatimonadota bacterium]